MLGNEILVLYFSVGRLGFIPHIAADLKDLHIRNCRWIDGTMSRSPSSRERNQDRRRSASPVFGYGTSSDESSDKEFEAELGRRSQLTPIERLEEDGRDLQRQIDLTPAIVIVLQPSPPTPMGKEQCRAMDCLSPTQSPRHGHRIMDIYRIM